MLYRPCIYCICERQTPIHNHGCTVGKLASYTCDHLVLFIACRGDGTWTDAAAIARNGVQDAAPFFRILLTKPYRKQVGIGNHFYSPTISTQSVKYWPCLQNILFSAIHCVPVNMFEQSFQSPSLPHFFHQFNWPATIIAVCCIMNENMASSALRDYTMFTSSCMHVPRVQPHCCPYCPTDRLFSPLACGPNCGPIEFIFLPTVQIKGEPRVTTMA